MNSPARIYLWQGRALIIGPAIDSAPHRHFAMQLTLSLDQPFTLHVEGQAEQSVYGSLFLPGQEHQLAGQGATLAHLFIDPGERSLTPWEHGLPHRFSRPQLSLVTPLKEMLANGMSGDTAERVACLWQQQWLPGFERAPALDARVARAIRLMAEDLERWPIDALGHELGLSSSRLSHLFSEQTGLTCKRYRTWQRLLLAVTEIAAGHTLTDAAFAAGFADLAHMSRTFQNTFGIAPSQLARMEIQLSDSVQAPDQGRWYGY